jgi:hypothetical protein
VVGIATWGPVRACLMEGGTPSAELREEWEERQGIVCLIDWGTARQVAGVSASRQAEMHAAMEAAKVRAVPIQGDQCWVSMIGQGEALRRRFESDLALLGQAECDVPFAERAASRSTYVVRGDDEARAVCVLHAHTFEAGTALQTPRGGD